MKKIFLILLLLISFPCVIKASDIPVARIGNTYYDTLEEAINAAEASDEIIMLSNLDLAETRNINKDITINLNGFTITKDETVFIVENGSLTLKGKGVIKETSPNYAPVVLIGSTDPNDTNYTNLYIDGDILLEGWSGIFIRHNEKKGYGINVDVKNITINSLTDSTGTGGSGIYVNGFIQSSTNYPVINIENVTINSKGTGLYLAGYAKTTIKNSNITGESSAIGIKSGILNINSGNFSVTGSENVPTNPSSNGINSSGSTIQIESNISYKGDMDITIEGGTFNSKNSYNIYEYIGSGNSTKVNNFLILDGTFISNKDNFLLSNSFINKNSPFIKGGTYSSDPSNYVVNGYKVDYINNDYEVKSVFKEENISNKSNTFIPIIISLVIAGTILYLLRKKKLSK